jgi:hypothetical protein
MGGLTTVGNSIPQNSLISAPTVESQKDGCSMALVAGVAAFDSSGSQSIAVVATLGVVGSIGNGTT